MVQMFMLRATQLLPQTRHSTLGKTATATLSANARHHMTFKVSPLRPPSVPSPCIHVLGAATTQSGPTHPHWCMPCKHLSHNPQRSLNIHAADMPRLACKACLGPWVAHL